MKKEYVITIRGRRSARVENGRQKRFGRSEYLARRIRGGDFAPFATSWEVLTQVPGVEDVATYYFNDNNSIPNVERGLWPYKLRDGDLLLIVMRRDGATVTMSAGWSVKTVGAFDVWWTYWHEGDPRSVTITVSGTPYDPNNPYAYDAAYWDGFFLPVRNVREVADPISQIGATSGSGSSVNFASVSAASANDMLVNVVFHASDENIMGQPYFSNISNARADVAEYESFTSGAIRDVAPGNLGLLMGTVADKGDAGATSATAPASAAWSTVSFTLPRIASNPKEPVTGRMPSPNFSQFDPLLFPGDILIRAGFNVYASAPWQLVSGFPDSSNGSYEYRIFWRRWKQGDTPDWFNANDGSYFIVARNCSRASDPFSVVARAGGLSATASTPAVSAKKGELVLLISQSPYLSMPYRYNETALDRYENEGFSDTVATGYVPSTGLVPQFTATLAYSAHWQSAVIVLKKR